MLENFREEVMKRRNLFGLLLLPALRLGAAIHPISVRLNDGSLVCSETRLQNGYLLQTSMRVGADGVSVLQYELTLTARRDAVVESLLRAAGLEMDTKTGFATAPGLLLTKIEDVEGDFNILVDGTVFLDGSISTKSVRAGQKVLIRALTGARMAAK